MLLFEVEISYHNNILLEISYHKKSFPGIKYFRIVHAPIFLRSFASDRRHVKDSVGNWIAEPPAYDPIISEDGIVHNLNEYMEIHSANLLTNVASDSINAVFIDKLGAVVSKTQLEEFFSKMSH